MAEYRELLPGEAEEVLIENREKLVRQITPKDIINSLFQRRVIDLDDLNEIKQEERQHGRRAGVEKLLDRIHRSGVDGLDKFIDSLESSGYADLANRLQESRQSIRKRAEQEKPKERSFHDKMISILEKNDVKPRGEIPSCHKKILRKHYLSILKNIRVNDIVDHLFSSEVIDWNEMDVVISKLKSEGNREALRYLMTILFNSSHTALPTFIDCLQQTRYDDIAKRLQDDEIDAVILAVQNIQTMLLELGLGRYG